MTRGNFAKFTAGMPPLHVILTLLLALLAPVTGQAIVTVAVDDEKILRHMTALVREIFKQARLITLKGISKASPLHACVQRVFQELSPDCLDLDEELRARVCLQGMQP